MLRIQVSSSDAGSADYTCPVNPYVFDPVDLTELGRLEILHGPACHQLAYFDDRARILTWPAYQMETTSITSIVDYFRSIKGETRYFYFRDIEDMNVNWPVTAVSASTASWKYARIINLNPAYRPGGKLRYDTVKLILQPEEPQ